jgi:very-short-patch-repair endonuclease
VAKYNPKIVLAYFRECGLPPAITELQFALPRKFRFDFAWAAEMVALEVEGGVFIRGAHGSASGIIRDIEKYNLATCLGWKVLRVLPQHVCMQVTVEMVKTCLNLRSPNS